MRRGVRQLQRLVMTEPSDLGSASYTVDEALEALGLGKWHLALFCFSGLVWFSDSIEVMLLSFTGPAARCEWNLSPHEESLLTSIVFLGMLLGAWVWGAVSDALGRRKAYVATAVTTAVFGILSAMAPSYNLLLLTRAGVGFGLAGAPAQYTLFMEWLPPSMRGRLLIAINIWWTMGAVTEAAAAAALLNDYGWRVLLGVSAIPLVLLLVVYPWVPDSPRLLLAQGRRREALRLLQRAAAMNGVQLPPGRLVLSSCSEDVCESGPSPALSPGPSEQPVSQEADESEGLLAKSPGAAEASPPSPDAGFKRLWQDLRHLLHRDVLGIMGALFLVWWVSTFTYYGLVMLAAQLNLRSTDQPTSPPASEDSGSVPAPSPGDDLCTGPHGQLQLPWSSYRDVIISSCAELPSLAFCAVVVGSNSSTRHHSISLSLLVTAVALIPLWGQAGLSGVMLQLSLFFSRFFIMAAFTILYVFTPELLPTQIRALGLGACNSVSRLGGLVAPFVAVGMVQQGMAQSAAAIFVACCAVASGTMAVLGRWTGGKELKLQGAESER